MPLAGLFDHLGSRIGVFDTSLLEKLAQLVARVKHACLDGVQRNADDVSDFLD
jgi:hypothetical protein